MPYRSGDRHQIFLLPQTIEEFVNEDDPVRVYDAFIDALNQKELDLRNSYYRTGNPPYDPMTMVKILVYAYSYGWNSARKIERALHHNLSFIWLAGGLKPNFKTIAKFRKDNKHALKNVMKQCARLCLKMDLIEGNCLFVDGTKVRANASISQTKTKDGWQKMLKRVDNRIDEILAECDCLDEKESGSLVKLEKDYKGKQALKSKVQSILNEMEEEGLDKLNGTDTDCINTHGRQGSHAGYNVQSVYDEKNGLMVHVDVVAQQNDQKQFTNQIDQAIEVLEKPCKIAVADAGYANAEGLKGSLEQGIDVIVPSQRQIVKERHPTKPFDRDKFKYEAERDVYICPEGHVLTHRTLNKKRGEHVYRTVPSTCKQCKHFGECTKGQRGREIRRLVDEEVIEHIERRYDSEKGKSIYKKRKEIVEYPFGHIKRTLKGGSFLVRGIEAVLGEASIYGSCFNIARMITLLGGVRPAVKKMRAMAC